MKNISFVAAIEILAFIGSLFFVVLWVRDPNGPYEPLFALCGLVFLFSELYRRYILPKSKKSPSIATNNNSSIVSMLGVLANDIKECIEGAQQMVVASEYGPSHSPIDLHPLELKNYERLKNDLIKANVFTAKEWNLLDGTIDEVNTVNDFNANRDRTLAGSRIYHSVNNFSTRWNMVASKYIQYGGNPNDLVKPFRINLDRS